MGFRGKMWRVIKQLYDVTQSAVVLEGEESHTFDIKQARRG